MPQEMGCASYGIYKITPHDCAASQLYKAYGLCKNTPIRPYNFRPQEKGCGAYGLFNTTVNRPSFKRYCFSSCRWCPFGSGGAHKTWDPEKWVVQSMGFAMIPPHDCEQPLILKMANFSRRRCPLGSGFVRKSQTPKNGLCILWALQQYSSRLCCLSALQRYPRRLWLLFFF